MSSCRIAIAIVCAVGGAGVAAQSAKAQVRRYAVVIGNNVGAPDEATLQYAQDDANKVATVLQELGGFAPQNTTVVGGRDAKQVRSALIETNERVRLQARNGVQSILVVYYSGHADARALHLGSSSLDIAQLEQLVVGSAATFRILILDSCRSGALTRVKGGVQAPPVHISVANRLAGEGVVFLTASSANEDAQESNELKGSFFTHYLVSGMVGAADDNGDGRVTLQEAYAFAYDATLRASSRTLGGMQHPTFRYQLRGQGDLALTSPVDYSAERATVAFPRGRTYLVMARDRHGAVVAEVNAFDQQRTISLRPGRYFVRGRATRYLLEGTLDAQAGHRQQVDDAQLHRIEYARLVRKGGAALRAVHGPQLGYRVRSALGDESACHGPTAGYGVDLHDLSLSARVEFCRSAREGVNLREGLLEAGVTVQASRVWDFPFVSVGVGVSLGGAMVRQSFDTAGQAPDRILAAPNLAAHLGALIDLRAGFYAGADVAARTYFFRQQQANGTARGATTANFTVGTNLTIGKRW